jgi:thiol-disulfide isomerase/thioredoxin/Flp pilus assembly protein TadD
MNRRILTTSLAAGTLLLSLLATAFADEVDWAQPPYQDILKVAKQDNKHIFIDFFTTWCGPCKQLDKVTYRDEKVVAYLNSIVPVKYDAEKDEGEELASRFRIKAYPTLVLVGPDGKEVDRHVGFLGPEDFLAVIGGYQKGIGTVAFYQAQLEKNPNDVEVLFELGKKHADAIRPDEAKAMLEKVLQLSPDSEHKAEILSSLGYVMYADDRFDEAKAYYDRLIAEFPDGKYHDEALIMQARVFYRLDQPEHSIKNYLVYLDRHPDDPSAMNSFAWFCAQRQIGFEQALPVALNAAELSGRDPGILDTLAELYYSHGDYGDAIRIGEEALAKEPDDRYLKDQLKKYREAADEAGEGDDEQARHP